MVESSLMTGRDPCYSHEVSRRRFAHPFIPRPWPPTIGDGSPTTDPATAWRTTWVPLAGILRLVLLSRV